ncbi:MAG: hypothetical protein HRF50_12910 [Phycisphaerae bacterium]
MAFVITIAGGLLVGNSFQTVLSRSLTATVAALLIGQFVAWSSKLVLRDYLQRRKVQIDTAHAEAAAPAEAGADGRTAAKTG